MQHRRGESKIAPGMAVGIAWFSSEEWHKLTEVVPDRSELDDTYEQWEKNANRAIRNFVLQGVKTSKVVVVIAELLAWCEENGRVPNGASRAEFVSYILQSRSKPGT